MPSLRPAVGFENPTYGMLLAAEIRRLAVADKAA